MLQQRYAAGPFPGLLGRGLTGGSTPEQDTTVSRMTSLNVVEDCLHSCGKRMNARWQQIVRRGFQRVAEPGPIMDQVKSLGPIGPLLQIWVGSDDPVLS